MPPKKLRVEALEWALDLAAIERAMNTAVMENDAARLAFLLTRSSNSSHSKSVFTGVGADGETLLTRACKHGSMDVWNAVWDACPLELRSLCNVLGEDAMAILAVRDPMPPLIRVRGVIPVVVNDD